MLRRSFPWRSGRGGSLSTHAFVRTTITTKSFRTGFSIGTFSPLSCLDPSTTTTTKILFRGFSSQDLSKLATGGGENNDDDRSIARRNRPTSSPRFSGPQQNQRQASAAPLGSMTDSDWEESFATMVQYFEHVNRRGDDVYYWMNKVDKLLGRLQAEFATKSRVSRTRSDDLLEAQLLVMEAWCNLALLFPENNMAVERATSIFWNIVQRSPNPWWKSTVNAERTAIMAESLLDLLASIVEKDRNISEPEMKHALRIISWKDFPVIFSSFSDNNDNNDVLSKLPPIYGSVMQLFMARQDEETVANLEKQWKRISDKDIWGWITYEPQLKMKQSEKQSREKGRNRNYDAFSSFDSVESVPPDGSASPRKTLSSYELEQMIKDTLSIFQLAGPQDEARIEQVTNRWDRLIITGEAQPPPAVVHAILDYYARKGDTARAIKWLSRMNFKNNNNGAGAAVPPDLPSGLNDLVVSLAKDDQDPTTIWRAEEILRQLEKCGAGDGLDSSTYAAVAERWLHSNEIQAHRRVIELCYRPSLFNSDLVRVLLKAIRREKKVPPDILQSILDWFEKERKSIDPSARRDLLEGILYVLQRHGDHSKGWEFFKSEINDGTLVADDKICELVLSSLPGDSTPDDVMGIYYFLESKNVPASLGFFQVAVKRLVDMHHQERIEHIVALNEAVVERVQDGSIDPRSPRLADFFETVFTCLSDRILRDTATNVLNATETALLPKEPRDGFSPLPTSCYSLVASIFVRMGDLTAMEALFQKLKSLFQSGYTNLHPDNSFYLSYIRALGDAASNPTEKISTVDRQREILNDLQQHYKVTGDAQYKPLPGMYRHMLSMLASIKEPTMELCEKADSILKEMIATDAVDVDNADPFTITMHIALQSRPAGEFPEVCRIRNLMKDCQVKESDLVFVNILRGCTRTNGNEEREEAVRVTIETLSDFRKAHRSQSSTNGVRVYSLAFESIIRNLQQRDKRKYPIISKLFECCLEDGYLDTEIVDKVRRSVSKTYFSDLYESRLLYGGVEPREWRRNNSKR